MTVHWPSFLIGMAVPLVVATVFLMVASLRSARRSRESHWSGVSRAASGSSSEHLRFTSRLMGDLRKQNQHEDHAQAS
jgi:hypothetical protein